MQCKYLYHHTYVTISNELLILIQQNKLLEYTVRHENGFCAKLVLTGVAPLQLGSFPFPPILNGSTFVVKKIVKKKGSNGQHVMESQLFLQNLGVFFFFFFFLYNFPLPHKKKKQKKSFEFKNFQKIWKRKSEQILVRPAIVLGQKLAKNETQGIVWPNKRYLILFSKKKNNNNLRLME
jgi:hypothetical protein